MKKIHIQTTDQSADSPEQASVDVFIEDERIAHITAVTQDKQLSDGVVYPLISLEVEDSVEFIEPEEFIKPEKLSVTIDGMNLPLFSSLTNFTNRATLAVRYKGKVIKEVQVEIIKKKGLKGLSTNSLSFEIND